MSKPLSESSRKKIRNSLPAKKPGSMVEQDLITLVYNAEIDLKNAEAKYIDLYNQLEAQLGTGAKVEPGDRKVQRTEYYARHPRRKDAIIRLADLLHKAGAIRYAGEEFYEKEVLGRTAAVLHVRITIT